MAFGEAVTKVYCPVIEVSISIGHCHGLLKALALEEQSNNSRVFTDQTCKQDEDQCEHHNLTREAAYRMIESDEADAKVGVMMPE